MFESILNLFTATITDIGNKKKLISALVIVALTIISITLFETQTHYFSLIVLKNKIEHLQALNSLRKDSIEKDTTLAPLYSKLLREYQDNIYPLNYGSIISLNDSSQAFLAGGAIWILLSVAGLFGSFGTKLSDKIASIFLFVVLFFFFGWISSLIPIYSEYKILQFISYPVFQLVFLIIIGLIIERK